MCQQYAYNLYFRWEMLYVLYHMFSIITSFILHSKLRTSTLTITKMNSVCLQLFQIFFFRYFWDIMKETNTLSRKWSQGESMKCPFAFCGLKRRKKKNLKNFKENDTKLKITNTIYSKLNLLWWKLTDGKKEHNLVTWLNCL